MQRGEDEKPKCIEIIVEMDIAAGLDMFHIENIIS